MGCHATQLVSCSTMAISLGKENGRGKHEKSGGSAPDRVPWSCEETDLGGCNEKAPKKQEWGADRKEYVISVLKNYRGEHADILV